MAGTSLNVDLAGSVLRVAHSLDAASVPYAIGGAIALALHGHVRATRDVDVNAYCPDGRVGDVVKALEQVGMKVDPARAEAEARSEGWFTAWDGDVRVDVFLPSIDFSWESMKSRVRLDYLGEPIWFLSVEALCVFKLLFFRTKDLADLEQLVMTSTVDHAAVRATMVQLMGAEDARVRAWDDIVKRFAPAR